MKNFVDNVETWRTYITKHVLGFHISPSYIHTKSRKTEKRTKMPGPFGDNKTS